MSAESHILPISLAAPQVREYFREKIAVMEKNYWLLLALLAFALPVVGCSDDEDEEELVGNWVKVSDFDGVARCSAVTFTVGGKVYVAAEGYGGYKYRLNDLWAFNEDSGTWTQMASMEGVARTYAVGFSTELYGYVGLGYDGDNYLKDFWTFGKEDRQACRIETRSRRIIRLISLHGCRASPALSCSPGRESCRDLPASESLPRGQGHIRCGRSRLPSWLCWWNGRNLCTDSVR